MKFRKRPVVIEAMQFKIGMYDDEIAKFVTCDFDYSTGEGDKVYAMTIPTLGGDMDVFDGDWIIKGVAGEFYPCSPDIFEKTYELVEG